MRLFLIYDPMVKLYGVGSAPNRATYVSELEGGLDMILVLSN